MDNVVVNGEESIFFSGTTDVKRERFTHRRFRSITIIYVLYLEKHFFMFHLFWVHNIITLMLPVFITFSYIIYTDFVIF